MPDVVDVGPSFTTQMVDKGYAETYKPTAWDEIPDNLKDPNGQWVAAYYGVLSIASNTTLVKNPPKTFADLKKPEYKGQVTINGDPREAGAAFAAVMAASLANGGVVRRHHAGHPVLRRPEEGGQPPADRRHRRQRCCRATTPIALDWTYNFPALQTALADAGFAMQVTVPSRRRVRRLLRAVGRHARASTRAPHGCGSSTSSATTARSAT